MLNSIIRWSVHNKWMVGLLLTVWVGAGLFSLARLPIDAVPDITNNQVQIITQAPALSALEMEKYVTQPLEIELRNIPDLHEIRSISRMGLSVITVVFEDQVSPYLCRQMVAEKIAQTENLGAGAAPVLAPITTGLGEIYQYTLEVKPGFEQEYDLMKLRTIQDWVVKRQLAGINGVVEISSFGGQVQQYQVSVNAARLASVNIGFEQVMQALEANNANTGGSYIEKEGSALFIRTEGILESKEDIAQIVVANKEGVPIRLEQIATIEHGFAVRNGAMTRNGQGETVGGIVLMLKGGDSGKTIEGVKKRIAEIEASLPPGIRIVPFIDRSKLINNTISTVKFNLIEGGVIVVVCLVLLLGSFRSGLLVASVIPLSMLFAFTLMRVTGTSANLMSLGAIDFGLIVDGAVVIVEAMLVQMSISSVQANRNQLAIDASGKIMNTALFGQLIILSVYLPVYALGGIEGKMFMPMALTVSFALAGSAILCLTYIPTVSSVFLKSQDPLKNRSEIVMHKISERYQYFLTNVLPAGKWIIAVAVALFILFIWRLVNMGGEFLPKLEEGDFAIETRLPTGSSLSETIARVTKAEKLLLDSFPEAKSVVSKVGTSEIPTDPMPLEAADIIVSLKDKKQWRYAGMNELAAAMENVLSQVEGVKFEVQQPIEMRFNELMTGVRSDVAIKFFGANLDTLLHLAETFAVLAPTVEGVANVKVEPVEKIPQINIRYKREMLARYGVDIHAANACLRMAYAGQKAGLVYEGDKFFDVVLRLENQDRNNLDQLPQLPVQTSGGNWVTLAELADITMVDAPMQISRDQAKRRVVVGVNIRDRDVESVVADLRVQLTDKMTMPVGYSFHIGGEFENLQHAKDRLKWALPVTLLLIFLFLFLAFRSMKEVLLIFSAVPLATIGGILALELRGMHFSISAAVGFIALFGVAVLNSMLLIQQYKTEKLLGQIDYGALAKASASRLRPVLTTALVASLGFLPMALSTTAGAEVQKPLATVVIGGLVTSTLLTLFVLPALYWQIEKWRFKIKGSSAAVLLFLLSTLVVQAQNQTSFTLNKALEYAEANNLYVKALERKQQGIKALVGTAWELPQTQLEYQRGQVQFFPIDYTFVISQSFQLPGVYMRQKELLEVHAEQSAVQVSLIKRELKRDIRLLFVGHFMSAARLKQLTYQDSVFKQARQIAAQRVAIGESDKLLLQSLETQMLQLEVEAEQFRNQAKLAALSLQQMLSLREVPLMETELLKGNFNTGKTENHPWLEMTRQDKKSAESQLRLDKTRWWPTVSLGYVNQSVERNRNLQYGMAGLSVPLFIAPYKARQKASTLLVEQKALEVDATQLALQNRLEINKLKVENLQLRLEQFENNILNQARQNEKLARQRWQLGQLDFFQFLIIVQQGWQAERQALELTEQWQQALVELSFFQGE